MVPPVLTASALARNTGNALEWDLRGMRAFHQAEALVRDVAARLPYFVPRTGLLMLDWSAVSDGDTGIRVRPRVDLHSEPWLALPVAAIRPTGASVHLEEIDGERILALQLPARKGRKGARVPLSTGLMRMSMQAHDEHVRFLPVVTRSDLVEDRYGRVSLHLHSLDLAALVARRTLEEGTRRQLVSSIAERVLALMGLPGAGLAREAPMLVETL